MADDLRGKLKALVEKWRSAQSEGWTQWCADQLAAILAESEPGVLDICPGCGVTARHLHEVWIDTDGTPHTCGAKAGLPLGHEFVPCDCLATFRECQMSARDRCHEGFSTFCGQPRAAHEVIHAEACEAHGAHAATTCPDARTAEERENDLG